MSFAIRFRFFAGLTALALLTSSAQGGTRRELRYAVYTGDAQEVARLVRGGANPNARTPNGYPLLNVAAIMGNGFAVMETLLTCGARVNVRDRDGRTSLMHAVREPGKTALLLRHKANPDIADRKGQTALLKAVNGHENSFRMLLVAGANPNVRDFRGFRPIQLVGNNLTDLRLLLDYGARLDILSPAARLRLLSNVRAAGRNDSSFYQLLLDELPHVMRSVFITKTRETPSRTSDLCLLAEEYLRCFDTIPAILLEPLTRALRTDDYIRWLAKCDTKGAMRQEDSVIDRYLMATAAIYTHSPLLFSKSVEEGLTPQTVADLLYLAVERKDTVMARTAAEVVWSLDAGDEWKAIDAGIYAIKQNDIALYEIVRSAGVSLSSIERYTRVPSKYKYPIPPRQPAKSSKVTLVPQFPDTSAARPDTAFPQTSASPPVAADTFHSGTSLPDTIEDHESPSPPESPAPVAPSGQTEPEKPDTAPRPPWHLPPFQLLPEIAPMPGPARKNPESSSMRQACGKTEMRESNTPSFGFCRSKELLS